MYTSVSFGLPLSTVLISAFVNLSFYGITSIESIVLEAQKDRACAFQRQGVLGTERKPN